MIKTPLSTVTGGAFWTPGATIIGSSSKNLSQLIKSLFANQEQGLTRDPYDLSAMFQDAAGSIPVTAAGQPVGLMLDKSGSLITGSELILVLDLTTWTIVGTTIATKNSYTTESSGGVRLSGVLQSGIWYKCIMDIESSGGVQLYDGQAPIPLGGVGRRTITLYYKAGSSGFYLRNSGVGTTTIHSLSIESIAGNHAYQTTSSMRPLLVAAPQRLDYDTVDDKLITNLPTQLTGCTVIRSVPNVGTQILTGQTIPATYEDNTDHCGLIVINRALTASETSQITKIFNKAAGV